jgi:hypothetical protein
MVARSKTVRSGAWTVCSQEEDRRLAFGPCLALWASGLVRLWPVGCTTNNGPSCPWTGLQLLPFRFPAHTTRPPAGRLTFRIIAFHRSKFLSYRGPRASSWLCGYEPAPGDHRISLIRFGRWQRAGEWRSRRDELLSANAVQEDHHGKSSNSKIWHLFSYLFN